MSQLRKATLARLLTTFAWMGGVLCLLAVVAGPAWYHLIHVNGLRSDIADAAEDIVSAQKNELVVRERFLSFDTRSQQPASFASAAGTAAWLNDRRLILSGWQKQNGHFLIRVLTRPEVIEDRWLPAILLERELDPAGRTIRTTWVE
ncbi:hypothetical protein [Minwuia sp.]|uniref:hypothetical protein n=1 Tax=Minwuia sp. TaxID=2493630 RepID=UPI003A95DE22